MRHATAIADLYYHVASPVQLVENMHDEPSRHLETVVFPVAMHVVSHVTMQAVAKVEPLRQLATACDRGFPSRNGCCIACRSDFSSYKSGLSELHEDCVEDEEDGNSRSYEKERSKQRFICFEERGEERERGLIIMSSLPLATVSHWMSRISGEQFDEHFSRPLFGVNLCLWTHSFRVARNLWLP